jgi:hypothetical protein
LRAFGLTEGSGNTHPGQGTANRRFFFANAFIELLWIEDEGEVASAVTAPTRLRERLSGGADVSPFGICYRPSADQSAATFATFAYTPSYLPPGMSIDIARDTPLSEPMCFFFRPATAPESWEGARRQPLQHATGLQRITDIAYTTGDGHLLEITFDNAAQGLQKDFRPTLPLIFRY